MPKRSYPFEEAFCPQSKIHVNEKKVECGVQRKSKMKAVYDRTLNLLFSGAKNLMNNNTIEAMDINNSLGHPIPPTATAFPATATFPPSATSHTTLHQLVLTPRGTLTRSSDMPQSVVPDKIGGMSACVGCRRLVVPAGRPSCSYCECRMCDNCLRSCHFCGGTFCTKCSLSVYVQEERVVCLSCC